jgi:hypothetical protein
MKEPLSPQIMNTNGPAHLTLRKRVKTLIDLKRDIDFLAGRFDGQKIRSKNFKGHVMSPF